MPDATHTTSRADPPDRSLAALWRRLSLLLILTGFVTIAWTGELGLPVSVLGLGLWGYAWRITAPPAWWRKWMRQGIEVTAIVVIGMIGLGQTFSAVLYLLSFLAIHKCYSLRTIRDHLHAILITMLMFLASAVIMQSIVFALSLVCMVVLIVLNLMCMAIARDASRSHPGKANEAVWQQGLEAPRGFHRTGSVLSAFVFVMMFIIFLFIPHSNVNPSIPGRWQQRLKPALPQSGYDDSVSLTQLESIEPDDTIVMNVTQRWADGSADRPLPQTLRLRGAVLDGYDEFNWYFDHRHGYTPTRSRRDVELAQPVAWDGPELIVEIVQNAAQLNRLFSVPNTSRLQILSQENWPIKYNPSGQSIRLTPPTRQNRIRYPTDFQYRIYTDGRSEGRTLISKSLTQSPEQLGAHINVEKGLLSQALKTLREMRSSQDEGNSGAEASGKLTPKMMAINLQLPDTRRMQRIRSLAAEQIGALETPQDKILELLRWFHRDFKYTLQPQTPDRVHPLDAFLFDTHKGHCEYFASAMVLMLRSEGIPSRLITGFLTGETPDGGQKFIVRQSDAHAWVEVWLDGLGWLTVDPTPPDHRGRASYGSAGRIFWVRQISRLRKIWRSYVVDYTPGTQRSLVGAFTSAILDRPLEWLAQYKPSGNLGSWLDFSDWLKKLGVTNETVADALSVLLTLAILIGLGFTLRKLWLFLRARSKRRHYERSPVEFMEKLLTRIERLGVKRDPSQTPAELLQRVTIPTEQREEWLWLLGLYQQIRFNAYEPTRNELTRAWALVHAFGEE